MLKLIVFCVLLIALFVACELIVNGKRKKEVCRCYKPRELKPWIAREVKFLKDNYKEIKVKSIAKDLDRTIFSVYNKIKKLNLK